MDLIIGVYKDVYKMDLSHSFLHNAHRLDSFVQTAVPCRGNVLQIRGVGNQERGMNPNHSIV